MKKRRAFQFKQFAVAQENVAMPVTTDACLFGTIADFTGCKYILDIGAGSGLLSLMIAQRFPETHITAIELDAPSAEDAATNFLSSPWSDRLHLVQGDINHWDSGQLFDGIICNPPFFENQLESEGERKRNARHTNTLTHESVLDIVTKKLNPLGVAWILIPTLHEISFIETAIKRGLFLSKKISILADAQKPAHLQVVCLNKNQAPLSRSEIITYGQGHVLSAQAVELLRPFYTRLT